MVLVTRCPMMYSLLALWAFPAGMLQLMPHPNRQLPFESPLSKQAQKFV